VISLDCDGQCGDYEDYRDDKEWQTPYWKRLMCRDPKQAVRCLFHGKEIEIGGIKFFVDVKGDYTYATEKTTGLSAGRVGELENRIEKIRLSIEKCDFPPLDTLPIGEYDEKTGKVSLKKEGE
jgi:hypothetical protein